jgi:hypothetical protein
VASIPFRRPRCFAVRDKWHLFYRFTLHDGSI